MHTAPPLPPRPAPPSTEWLRQQALARSQRRGVRVARRRVAWRWTLWGLGRAGRMLAWPTAVGLVLAAAVWAWRQQGPDAPVQATPPPPGAALRAQAERAGSAASPGAGERPAPGQPTPLTADDAALPPARPALPLRLDAEDPPAEPLPAAAQAASPPLARSVP